MATARSGDRPAKPEFDHFDEGFIDGDRQYVGDNDRFGVVLHLGEDDLVFGVVNI
jgi:hypothetical protein